MFTSLIGAFIQRSREFVSNKLEHELRYKKISRTRLRGAFIHSENKTALRLILPVPGLTSLATGKKNCIYFMDMMFEFALWQLPHTMTEVPQSKWLVALSSFIISVHFISRSLVKYELLH